MSITPEQLRSGAHRWSARATIGGQPVGLVDRLPRLSLGLGGRNTCTLALRVPTPAANDAAASVTYVRNETGVALAFTGLLSSRPMADEPLGYEVVLVDTLTRLEAPLGRSLPLRNLSVPDAARQVLALAGLTPERVDDPGLVYVVAPASTVTLPATTTCREALDQILAFGGCGMAPLPDGRVRILASPDWPLVTTSPTVYAAGAGPGEFGIIRAARTAGRRANLARQLTVRGSGAPVPTAVYTVDGLPAGVGTVETLTFPLCQSEACADSIARRELTRRLRLQTELQIDAPLNPLLCIGDPIQVRDADLGYPTNTPAIITGITTNDDSMTLLVQVADPATAGTSVRVPPPTAGFSITPVRRTLLPAVGGVRRIATTVRVISRSSDAAGFRIATQAWTAACADPNGVTIEAADAVTSLITFTTLRGATVSLAVVSTSTKQASTTQPVPDDLQAPLDVLPGEVGEIILLPTNAPVTRDFLIHFTPGAGWSFKRPPAPGRRWLRLQISPTNRDAWLLYDRTTVHSSVDAGVTWTELYLYDFAIEQAALGQNPTPPIPPESDPEAETPPEEEIETYEMQTWQVQEWGIHGALYLENGDWLLGAWVRVQLFPNGRVLRRVGWWRGQGLGPRPHSLWQYLLDGVEDPEMTGIYRTEPAERLVLLDDATLAAVWAPQFMGATGTPYTLTRPSMSLEPTSGLPMYDWRFIATIEIHEDRWNSRGHLWQFGAGPVVEPHLDNHIFNRSGVGTATYEVTGREELGLYSAPTPPYWADLEPPGTPPLPHIRYTVSQHLVEWSLWGQLYENPGIYLLLARVGNGALAVGGLQTFDNGAGTLYVDAVFPYTYGVEVSDPEGTPYAAVSAPVPLALPAVAAGHGRDVVSCAHGLVFGMRAAEIGVATAAAVEAWLGGEALAVTDSGAALGLEIGPVAVSPDGQFAAARSAAAVDGDLLIWSWNGEAWVELSIPARLLPPLAATFGVRS